VTFVLTNTVTFVLTNPLTFVLTNLVTFVLTNPVTFVLTNPVTFVLTNPVTFVQTNPFKRLLWYYVIFLKTKLQNVKISTVTLQNFKSSNVKMFELPNFQNVTLHNFKIFECQNVRITTFLKCQIIDIIKFRFYLVCSETPPYWAALFSDNYPLRGVFRLG
jgi:hypothetical protein